MSRRLLCQPCGIRWEPAGRRLLLPATEMEPGEWGRLVVGVARQPSVNQRVLRVNGEQIELDASLYNCDGCGAEIRPGDQAMAHTIWLDDHPEPPAWEGEFLEAPDARPDRGVRQ